MSAALAQKLSKYDGISLLLRMITLHAFCLSTMSFRYEPTCQRERLAQTSDGDHLVYKKVTSMIRHTHQCSAALHVLFLTVEYVQDKQLCISASVWRHWAITCVAGREQRQHHRHECGYTFMCWVRQPSAAAATVLSSTSMSMCIAVFVRYRKVTQKLPTPSLL